MSIGYGYGGDRRHIFQDKICENAEARWFKNTGVCREHFYFMDMLEEEKIFDRISADGEEHIMFMHR